MTGGNGAPRATVPWWHSVVLFVGFRAILDWTYLVAIVPAFTDEGYTVSWSAERLVLSYVLTIAAALVTPSDVRRPSDLLVALLLLTPVLPTQTLMALRGDDVQYALLTTGAYLVIVGVRRVAWPKAPQFRHGAASAAAIAGSGLLITIAVLIARGGLAFVTLDAAAINLLRDTAIEQTSSGVFAYFVDWSAKVFVPVLAAVALLRGRWLLALVSLLGEIPLGALTAQKSPLGFIALLGVIVVAMRTRRPSVFVAGAFASMVAASVGLWTMSENPLLLSFVTRRIFFVPAHIDYAYYRFFSDAGFTQFSTILPSWASTYRFPFPPPQLIGDFLAPGTGMWANSSFLGTGYMNLGAAGLAVYSIAIGGLLGLADMLGAGRFLIPVAVLVAASFDTLFTSADLPTSLLTHGIALSLAFALLIRDPETAA
ncbi:MAG: hypothetical protein ACREPM_14505 [Gemmatimonadaceae bacterium]